MFFWLVGRVSYKEVMLGNVACGAAPSSWSIHLLVYENEKCSSKFPRAQSVVFKLLVLSVTEKKKSNS